MVDAGDVPHCVDFCPTGGLRFGDEEDFAEVIEKAEVLNPELGCKPRVYYLNNPKLFIGGDVWDPERDEIIEGANVYLYQDGMFISSTITDDFGDFYFKQLDAGTYTIEIECAGYQPVMRTDIVVDKSLNLGDFPLARA